MKQGARMARTAVFMVVAVLASKILGMLRDVLVAGAYGTSGEAVAYETGPAGCPFCFSIWLSVGW